MTITPVQPNIEGQKTYRDATAPIKTDKLVHPLPAEGHLVHDTLISVPKFWMKDIAYDIKAVKEGLSGKAKDHQTGRLNDVGLKLGGIGIATYLASRTTDPKMRVMEYVGLGAFLASMSLYPKIAINAPSRIIQGYDIGKEYIDDQGRKKSVYQDGNYIPMDMYRGEFVGEDLDIIGDRMGIPRDIKNRNELIKEQARKIAIQNNTLWMLSAGFATPVMTALICSGLEKVISPAMEKIRNYKYNKKITNILEETKNMTLELSEIDSNSLSKKVEKILNEFKNKELPKEEFNKIVKLLSDSTEENLKEGIQEDLAKLLKSEKNSFLLGENFTEEINSTIKASVTGRKKATLQDVFGLTKEEVEQALKKSGSDGKYMNSDQLYKFKDELKTLFKSKIEKQTSGKPALYMERDNVIEGISKLVQKSKSTFVSENNIKDITDFAKVLGDFKIKDRIIDNCKSFKVEYAPETVIARSYKEFENAIFEILDIKYKDLKQMKESDKYTKEILEKKIETFVKDKDKYEKGIKKLAKVISEMEIKLHGEHLEESDIKNLINAIENNYNKTAVRINKIGENKFKNTINKLVKEENVSNLKNKINSREDLFKLIDGIQTPILRDFKKPEDQMFLEYADAHIKGVGSSKALKISRIVDRIQGVKNGQYRLLHLLDVYHRDIPGDKYGKHLNKTVKDVIMEATASDHTLKLYTDNNPLYYIDIIRHGWETPLEKATKDALQDSNNIKTGDVFGRFKKYLNRFKDVIGNNDIDFTKPNHILVEDLEKEFRNIYGIDSTTRMQKFNLISQNPIEYFKKASKIRFENQKWLRIASMIGASVLTATIATQFCFGKIKNPHNIKKIEAGEK